MNAGRVVVAEDADDHAQIILAVLRKQGIQGEWFRDGADTYAAIEADFSSIRLLILDVMLPGMNGFEILRRLATRNLIPPTILLTGRNTDEDVAQGLDAGALDYVIKPFSPLELAARIRKILSRSGR